MSTIDAYRHRLVGFIQCPMKHSLFGDGRVFDKLPIYELLEAIEGEKSNSGEPGDIVIGGGSGEASAMRFSVPQLFHYYSHTTLAEYDPPTEPIKSHWTVNETYLFAQGFAQLGWLPEQRPLEMWLAEHLMAFLATSYPARYGHLLGDITLRQDGKVIERANDA